MDLFSRIIKDSRLIKSWSCKPLAATNARLGPRPKLVKVFIGQKFLHMVFVILLE